MKLFSCVFASAFGHGRILEPPGRSSYRLLSTVIHERFLINELFKPMTRILISLLLPQTGMIISSFAGVFRHKLITAINVEFAATITLSLVREITNGTDDLVALELSREPSTRAM